MTPRDARTDLPKLERQMTADEAHLANAEAALTVVSENIDTLTARADLRPLDTLDQRKLEQLREAHEMILNGVRHRDGIAFEFLAPLADKPGLLRMRERITERRALIAEMRTLLERWPTDDTEHPFRYIGRPQQTVFDKCYVRPGEVVMLNASRAEAWGDLFEPVTVPLAAADSAPAEAIST